MVELDLDHYGGRHERHILPTLQDLLDCKDPFWIFTRGNSGRNHKIGLVYAQLHKAPDYIMRGIHLIDREGGVTFVAERGSMEFKQRDGILVPFNRGKFYCQGCRYELAGGDVQSLIREFQDCGYAFMCPYDPKQATG